MPERLVIIGSGPAAWAAAIYAGRAALEPVVYEGAVSLENQSAGTLPLGQLNWTWQVENYPGFPEGIAGQELVTRFREQADRCGARILTEDVRSADLSRRPFLLSGTAGAQFECHAVIVATGARFKRLELESARRFATGGTGLTVCVGDDGALPRFRNQPFVVIGGGDSAAQAALWMTRFASRVYVVHRRDRLRAARVYADAVQAHERITVLWNSEVREILGRPDDTGVTAVRFRDVVTGRESTVGCSGVAPLIGCVPNTEFLRGQVRTDAAGYLVLKDPSGASTHVEGVFAAGEVADPVYRQAVTAAAMGCKAALDAERWLAVKGGPLTAEAGRCALGATLVSPSVARSG